MVKSSNLLFFISFCWFVFIWKCQRSFCVSFYRRDHWLIISPSVSVSHMLFFCQWCLSDCKSPEIFRTLLNILTYLNNSVVYIITIFIWFSISAFFLSSPFENITNTAVTIVIYYSFMFYSFMFYLFAFFYVLSVAHRNGEISYMTSLFLLLI